MDSLTRGSFRVRGGTFRGGRGGLTRDAEASGAPAEPSARSMTGSTAARNLPRATRSLPRGPRRLNARRGNFRGARGTFRGVFIGFQEPRLASVPCFSVRILHNERCPMVTPASGGYEPHGVDVLRTYGEGFAGREAELAALDRAWNEGTRVFVLHAEGGAGKTRVVAKWLTQVRDDGWRGAGRVFVHSFYSQGSDERRNASSELFFEQGPEALRPHRPAAHRSHRAGEDARPAAGRPALPAGARRPRAAPASPSLTKWRGENVGLKRREKGEWLDT